MGGLDKKLTVAVAAGDGAVEPTHDREPQLLATGADALFDKGVQGGIFHNAAFAHLAGLQFKLRLDQHQQIGTWLEQRHQSRQHQRLGDERLIADDEVKPGGRMLLLCFIVISGCLRLLIQMLIIFHAIC